MRSIFFIFCIFIYFIFAVEGHGDDCCIEQGIAIGLLCRCRASCAGRRCDSSAQISATCGNGVCCCGTGCIKPINSELDQCPTQPPSANPSISPTVPQCADWNPEPPAPTTNPAGIPVPDISQSPQLCQLGKSGEWRSVDRWYSWDCSCHDVLTSFKLTQLIYALFYEFQLNYNDVNEQQEGRFESYLNNFLTEDIYMKTSVTNEPGGTGPEWNDLESLASCDPANPGFGEFSRQTAESMDFQTAPGGVFIHECIANGDVAYAQLKIDNYRIRDGLTENQVAFGDFILERQQGTNIWLIKEIVFTPQTVGFLPQQPYVYIT